MTYVYKHTFPNGKIYIGIADNCEARWNNGNGYSENKEMYADIKKYGWNNIKHEIIQRCYRREKAEELEKLLILAYQSEVPEIGYNRTTFREHLLSLSTEQVTSNPHTHLDDCVRKQPDPEWRKKLSKSVLCKTTGEIFSSIKEAAIAKGIYAGDLSQALKGVYFPRAKLGNCEWSYYTK